MKYLNERLKPGAVAYDAFAKEYVQVQTCCCMYDHSSNETFEKEHGPECVMVPREVIALRIVDIVRGPFQRGRIPPHIPVAGWVIREVRHHTNVLELTDAKERKKVAEMFTTATETKRTYLIGRA